MTDSHSTIDLWRKEVLRPIAHFTADKTPATKEDIAALSLPITTNLALLSADVDQVKSYVFDSPRLPEIRGASLILEGLNTGFPNQGYNPTSNRLPANMREALRRHGLPDGYITDDEPGCIVYAGGGSLLALVPVRINGELVAKRVKAEIEALYPRETSGGATITCVYCQVRPAELFYGPDCETTWLPEFQARRERLGSDARRRLDAALGLAEGDALNLEHWGDHRNLAQMRKQLGYALQVAKQSGTAPPFRESLPFARRCQSCGLRPATLMYRDRYLCAVCDHRGQKGWQGKGDWVGKFEEFVDRTAELRRPYKGGESWPDSYGFPIDLEELGQTSARQGYVGLIYADGNWIADYLDHQRSLRDFHETSQSLEDVAREAVFRALAEHLRLDKVTPSEERRTHDESVLIHPFEILTIGGDDVMLLVPGSAAIGIAARICHIFTESFADEGVSMSAGVVIADDHNPVYVLQDLASQLLKSAKVAGRDCSRLDWLILTSPSMLDSDLKTVRRLPPYRVEVDDDTLSLTGRPYTLPQIIHLYDLLFKMDDADLARGPLFDLVDTLYEGRVAGTLRYLYQFGRATPRQREVWEALHAYWEFRPLDDPIPWIHASGEGEYDYWTMLLDLVELYDFVPGENERSRGWLPLLTWLEQHKGGQR